MENIFETHWKLQKIKLNPDEKVLVAPATTDYLKIHGNGLMELIKPLNYEFEMSHQAAVQISGLFKGLTIISFILFDIVSHRNDHGVPIYFLVMCTSQYCNQPSTFYFQFYWFSFLSTEVQYTLIVGTCNADRI